MGISVAVDSLQLTVYNDSPTHAIRYTAMCNTVTAVIPVTALQLLYSMKIITGHTIVTRNTCNTRYSVTN